MRNGATFTQHAEEGLTMIADGTNSVDYGPLETLIGTWEGNKGLDVSPEEEGDEKSPYFEKLIFEPCGDVTNADRQTLVVLRYHQVVSRISNGEVFHNETGYYSYDHEADQVCQSFAIPRGIAVTAGGTAKKTKAGLELNVSAENGSHDWPIAESPFMRDNASTRSFVHNIIVDGDQLSYSETTVVDIFERLFDHTDANILYRS